MNKQLQELQAIIDSSKRIVAFVGAGCSTESGIPDFRSVDGLYRQKWRWPPEQILSHSFFMKRPEDFYRYYREKMMPLDAQPNAAHAALAKLEKAGRLSAVVTQNIDGLHQKAGSVHVCELHGSIWRNACMACGKPYSAEYVKACGEAVPHCECGGVIKPDVVLYEERLDDDVIEDAVAAIQAADTLIIAGTSMTVYPAAGLVQYFRGSHLVLINRDATPVDEMADIVIREPVGEVFSRLTITGDDQA